MHKLLLMTRSWSRRKRIIASVVVALILISISVGASLFWQIHEAGKVFGEFNQSLIAKDYRRAYGLTSPELKANVSYDKFVTVFQTLSGRVGDLRSYSGSEYEVKDEGEGVGYFAYIKAGLVFERGGLPFRFVLKKVDGRWLIYRFNGQ